MKENLEARQSPCRETKLAGLTVHEGDSAWTDRLNKLRPIDQVAEVDADWSYRCGISKSQPDRVRKIIQLVRAIELALCRIGGIEKRLRRRASQSQPPQPPIHPFTLL